MANDGTAFTEKLARRIKRMVLQWESLRVTGGTLHKGPTTASLAIEPTLGGGGSKLAIAKITDAGSTPGYYELAEVNAEGNTFTNARTWDATEGNQGEALEINGNDGLTADTLVLLKRDVDDEGQTLWVFDGPTGLPPGGVQYQVLQRDGSGNAVWDYPRAHA